MAAGEFLPGFLAAYAILLVAASSPGPAVALLLGVATSRGRTAALVAAWGIATGSVLINLATLVGVGYLLAQAAWAMSVLRAVGAAYLLWLAYGAFRKALDPPPIEHVETTERRGVRLFLAGFLLQVTNPKAIVFWLAIAAVGATRGGGSLVILLFVAGAFTISFVCHAGWALLLSSSPVRIAYSHGRRGIEGALGTFFAFAAFKMATARAP